MQDNKAVFLDTLSARLLLLLAVIAIAALAVFHIQLISVPTPIDFYEGAMPQFTAIIAAGGSPYSFESQPSAMNVYPPLYNLVVAPLSGWFGNTLILHRAVSGVFIVLSCALFGFTLWRALGEITPAVIASAMLYAGFLYHATPIAGTSATGLFFFLLSVLLPWLAGFTTPSLIVSVCTGVLAFYSKQYFGAGLAFLCGYLILCGEFRRGVIFGVSVAALVLLSLALVHKTQPYYLDNTYFTLSSAFTGVLSAKHAWAQMGFFLSQYPGLLLALLTALILIWPDRKRGEWLAWFQSDRQSYFWFLLAGSCLLIVTFLGRNLGNHGSYLFQLIAPFMLLAFFGVIQQARIRQPLILALLGWNLLTLYWMVPKQLDVDPQGWEKIDKVIASSDRVLASSILVYPQVRHGKPIHQNGHTFYFPQAANKPELFKHEDTEQQIDTIWTQFLNKQYQLLENREFDALLLHSWDFIGIFRDQPPPGRDVKAMQLVRKHYQKIETITVSLSGQPGGGDWEIQLWRPRPQTAGAD